MSQDQASQIAHAIAALSEGVAYLVARAPAEDGLALRLRDDILRRLHDSRHRLQTDKTSPP